MLVEITGWEESQIEAVADRAIVLASYVILGFAREFVGEGVLGKQMVGRQGQPCSGENIKETANRKPILELFHPLADAEVDPRVVLAASVSTAALTHGLFLRILGNGSRFWDLWTEVTKCAGWRPSPDPFFRFEKEQKGRACESSLTPWAQCSRNR